MNHHEQSITFCELNLDGLVGTTHHYAGLAPDNLASEHNALKHANPKAAALQGLKKIRFMHQHGIQQAILPPHARPNLALLNALGFTGAPKVQIEKAAKTSKTLLSACYSSASMWAANAATVSASCDTQDGLIHFTVANQISHMHRHQEAGFNRSLLQRLFPDPRYFYHHPALPSTTITSDEGAANHNRLCSQHEKPGIQLLVFGRSGLNPDIQKKPAKYTARQTLEASEAIARSHGLNPQHVVFAQQNPHVIDLGVFHHDVIGVSNENILLLHEHSLIDQRQILATLKQKADFEIKIIEVKNTDIHIEDAVSSYFFNSQLITKPQGGMMLVSPIECERLLSVQRYISHLIADSRNPIEEVHYMDLKQSMQNGGGPACLRLRIPISIDALMQMHRGILVHDILLDTLEAWVERHYRDQLSIEDLCDPALMDESFRALDELSVILKLSNIYPFQ